MFFNSFLFVFFFVIVWVITKISNQTEKLALRNLFLFIASFVFYAWFRLDFLIWLVVIIAVNYLGGLWLHFSASHRKLILSLLIVLSLLPLFIFKYTLFLTENLAALFGHSNYYPGIIGKLILPVGLSFFTFQALSYTIDLYRRKISVERNIIDFALFVAFFPTILSGPITRGRDLLPQMKQKLPMTLIHFLGGGQQFIWGLFKKCVVADRLAQYVDNVYAMPDAFSGKSVVLAAICYSIQIYCDFSGYSDMAIGTANALGFSLKKNFDFPYFAASIREFWKRWHISLTGWFTEYVYISCGGNRVGMVRWMLNIMLVFLVSGLWHGAQWTFLIWGGLHGILYLIEFFITHGKKEAPTSVFGKILGICMTFILVTFAWVFFRAPDFQTAVSLLQRIFYGWNGQLYTGASSFSFAVMIAVTLFTLLLDIMAYQRRESWDNSEVCSWYRLGISMFLLLGVELLAMPSIKFVYFLF